MNEELMQQTSAQAETVIWVASYPKSGNTWVQNVIRASGRKHGFPKKDLDVYKMMREGREPVVVDGVRRRLSASNTTVLKTHSNFLGSRDVHPELGLSTVGFVYVIRNPLDVLLSFINFSRIQYANNRTDESYQKKLFIDLLGFDKAISYDDWLKTTLDTIPRENLDHALSKYSELDTVIPNLNVAGGSWLNHATSWIEASHTMPSVVLRYEDLIGDKTTFLNIRELFRFTKKEVMGAISRVEKRSQKVGSDGKSIFLNKMTSFYYREYFSKPTVKAFIDKFGTRLETLGYGDLPSA